MQLERSLPHPQVPVTCPYLEPDQNVYQFQHKFILELNCTSFKNVITYQTLTPLEITKSTVTSLL